MTDIFCKNGVNLNMYLILNVLNFQLKVILWIIKTPLHIFWLYKKISWLIKLNYKIIGNEIYKWDPSGQKVDDLLTRGFLGLCIFVIAPILIIWFLISLLI